MKNKFTKFVVAPVVFLLVGTVFYFVYYNVVINSTATNIKLIKEHMNSSGTIVDIQNEIGVQSVEDIKLFVTTEEVRIQFGKLVLNWSPKNFAKSETQEQLSQIGFEIQFKGEPPKMYLYWHGAEVERWVR